MNRLVSLAHLTALSLAPPDLIRLAAGTGYDAVGLRLIGVTPDTASYPLHLDRPMFRETRRALSDTGLKLLDIEFLRLEPNTDPSAFAAALEAGAELGATQALLAAYDPEESRLSDNVAAIAEIARPLGIGVNLEFYPWTVVANLADAVRVIDRSGAENAGVLVDALHLARSGTTLEELELQPASRFRYLHLCDAEADHPGSLEGLLKAARAERLPPGEGGLDLEGFLRVMPADIPVALEVPMQARSALEGELAIARECRNATENLVNRLSSSGD